MSTSSYDVPTSAQTRSMTCAGVVAQVAAGLGVEGDRAAAHGSLQQAQGAAPLGGPQPALLDLAGDV